MKNILFSLLLFFSAAVANAQDICEVPCVIIIDFPTGGSITASDEMLISFGENGMLDLGETGTINTAIQPESLDFSAGGSLSLAAGESINFGDNAQLSLGDGGNINAASYNITTSGNIAILSVTSSVSITGSLEAEGSVLIDSREIFIEDRKLIASDEIITTGIDVSALGAVSISTDFSILGEGFVFPLDANTNCTVTGNQCITDDGTTYVLNDKGEAVEVKEGNGSINLLALFFLIVLIKRTKSWLFI